MLSVIDEKMLGKLFTPEEIAESDSKMSIIGELVEVRHEKGINQKKLKELSGVKQHDIARMERKVPAPLRYDVKVLAQIRKTLVVVLLESVGK